ncbi:hypothetical protein C8F04DRAFT_1138228 [Mycena alexandri]|uniref:Uncharacterized protein n=1 Tax=Mycena alexandri TaxID=1745969 RepID=A0AAD6S6Y2_9AGAR|nr:hypothetical protein C8F04DRAFT_1138228 [Mycena alexandri]
MAIAGINRPLRDFSSFGPLFLSVHLPSSIASSFFVIPSSTMLHILVFLPILSIAAHTNDPRRLHLARQKNILDCDTPCSVLSKAVAANGGEASSICTNALVNSQALCYGCEVKVAAITQEKAQSQLDKYVAGCTANGFAVDSVTVSPENTGVDDSVGSNSTGDSTSTTTTPAAPGGAPAASSPARSGSGSAPAQSVASKPQPQTGGAQRLSAGIVGAALALVSLAFGMVI